MADPMEMSLDDIIKKNRSTRGRRGGAGRGGGGPVRQNRGGNRQSPYKQQGQAGGGVRRGGRGGGGGQLRSAAGAGGGGGGAGAVSTQGHIVISNLDYQVSDADLRDLFGEFGSLKKVAVHYNAAGKSQGSADVIFSQHQDAARALQKYNGVPLDSRPMRILIVTSEYAQAVSAPQQRGGRGRGGRPNSAGGRGGAAVGAGARGGAGGRGAGRGGRGGRGRGSGGGAARSMTKEQLDAEIDAYHTQQSQEAES